MIQSPKKNFIQSILFVCFISSSSSTFAFEPNYDESKIPPYTLPEALVMSDGQAVKTADEWTNKRRPELLDLFRQHVYGNPPAISTKFQVTVLEENGIVPGVAHARRTLVRLTFGEEKNAPHLDLLLYLPAESKQPAPMFIGLNFSGNHTIWNDPAIPLHTSWARSRSKNGSGNNRATESSRGLSKSDWPVDLITSRGYALATIYYGDIAPDDPKHWREGVARLFPKENANKQKSEPAAIASWAWGLSRALDYLVTRKDINPKQVAVMGHSRLGKTALWAGAEDPRFALVISNNSGCVGAALSRRAIGETVGRINKTFPHWFTQRFNTYNENEAALPIDQHQLIALIAPRPVYIASARGDVWADPHGEYLSGWHAGPVYELFGKTGLPAKTLSDIDQSVGKDIGYHIRKGAHDVTLWDWERYLDFADRHFRAK
jgi:hypothetical protein